MLDTKKDMKRSKTALALSTKKIAELVIPWTLFMAILVWGWRIKDLFHTIPSYGDTLDVLWGIEWYGDRFPHGSTSFYPLSFHPQGWYVAAFAYLPGMFILLWPLYKLGGAACAHNVAALLSFFVTFAGIYRVTYRLGKSPVSATIASILFTFWGFRWFRIYGHMNILLGSSLLPWMAWGVERAFYSSHKYRVWFFVVGVLWALAVTNALYFTWLGGILLLGWIAGWCFAGRIGLRIALRGVTIASATALLLSSPVLVSFFRASAATTLQAYSIDQVIHWGASLNSLPTPYVFHPWLKSFARLIYQGPIDESGTANLGLLSCLVALIGLHGIGKDRKWQPALIVACLGVMLALGPFLRWNGDTIQSSLFEPVNSLFWQIGHASKPKLFVSDRPTHPFDQAIPLPGLILAAFIPFWEGIRTVSRFALVGGIGFFVLVARGVARLRGKGVRLALTALLIVEVVPPPIGRVPFPPSTHPAFEWLKQQALLEEGVVDLYTLPSRHLVLPISGETLWATLYHGKAAVSGGSSIWPAHTAFLIEWLGQHASPFRDPDFIPILRYYRVSYILLHKQGANTQDILQDAGGNEEVQLVECFDPPSGPSPWPHPICVIRVLTPSNPSLDVLLRRGWSGKEPWGIWADGTESSALWVATSKSEHRLLLEAFPHCVPGEKQGITLEVNGVQMLTYQWKDCEPWAGEVIVPAALVEVGWNEVRFHYAYAARPVDVTDGKNPDARMLSVGFTELKVQEAR